MHAIVQFQGRQYRVESGLKIHVPHLDAEPGAKLTIQQVLLVASEKGVDVGSPTVAGASVEGTVVRHFRGRKLIVGKYKKRKDYRRRKGHRDDLTEIQIGLIHPA